MKKRITHLILISFIIAGGFVFLHSCQKSDLDLGKISDEMEFRPQLVAPLIYGSLSLEDIVNKADSSGEHISSYEDGLFYVMFSDTVMEKSIEDFDINIANQGFAELYVDSDILSAAWTIGGVGDTVTFTKVKDGEFTFDNNERIDSVYVKTLNLVIDVSSTFKHTGILHMYSDFITIDGEPFEHEVTISDISGNFVYNTTIDLSGHTMYLDNSVPGSTYLPITFELKLVKSINPVLPGESCEITIDLEDIDYYSVYGYLGDYSEIESESVEFGMEDLGDFEGEIYIEDPQFTINVNNSFGVPFSIDLGGTSFYSSSKDLTTNFDLSANPYLIDAHDYDSIGYFKYSAIEINKDNSNIQDVISSIPSSMDFSINASTNPDGPGTQNFVTDSSKMIVDFEAVIPLHFRASGITLEDTTEFDLMDEIGDVVDMIERLNLSLDVINRLPLDVDLQLFFTDENYIVLDSMFADDSFLIGPAIDASGEIIEPDEYTKDIDLDKEKIEKIRGTKNLIIKALCKTSEATEGKSVKFYNDSDIEFKLKLDAQFRINTRELN